MADARGRGGILCLEVKVRRQGKRNLGSVVGSTVIRQVLPVRIAAHARVWRLSHTSKPSVLTGATKPLVTPHHPGVQGRSKSVPLPLALLRGLEQVASENVCALAGVTAVFGVS